MNTKKIFFNLKNKYILLKNYICVNVLLLLDGNANIFYNMWDSFIQANGLKNQTAQYQFSYKI